MTVEARPDGDLVELARAGDRDAFAELFTRYRGSVRAVVARYARTGEDANDGVGEVFRRALQRLPTLRDPERFGPWVLTIARYYGIDQLRRARDEHLDDDLVVADEGADPDTSLHLADLSVLLRGAIVKLPERDATVLTMVTYLDLGPTEVAEAFSVSYGAAKVMIHRARRRLRDTLLVEVALQAADIGCDRLRATIDAGDLRATARHLRSCERCERAVYDELIPRS